MGHSTLEMVRRYLSFPDNDSQKHAAKQTPWIVGDYDLLHCRLDYAI